jgi:uncharacterized protein (TIGR04141 family)
MPTTRKLTLTWCLFKDGVDTDDADVLIEEPETGRLERYKIESLHGTRDSLFVKRTAAVPPGWVSLLVGHIPDNDLRRLVGGSSSAALLVPAGDRLLAVTFGYGRFLVRDEAIDQDFGLKVVLNCVDPAQIKSVDARTFDEITVHTRRGVSRSSSLNAFELDVSRNLLRGVTGTSAREGLPGQLTGAATLTINSAATLEQLPELAATLLKAYKARRYRNRFAFIDDLRAERDPETIERLEALLLAALRAGELTEIHLAIPEAVDWQQIAGVKFSIGERKHQPMPDPRISTYLKLRKQRELTIEQVKRDRVLALGAVDEKQIVGRWRVYDCVVFEAEHDKHLYVLSGGDWYQVRKSYRDRVRAFVESLPVLKVGLPGALSSEDEDAYNQRAAAQIGALCLDRHLIKMGGRDSVEICDLLLSNGMLLHVKKRGRSSTLSHLFAQGVTSAELLLHDQEFLDEARSLVASANASFTSAVPARLQGREQIKVGYAVLSRSKRTDTPHGLPFFSLVSLQAAARHLRDAGIEVHIAHVPET